MFAAQIDELVSFLSIQPQQLWLILIAPAVTFFRAPSITQPQFV